MMFSDEEIKEMREGSFMKPGDELISIREVCLSDKYDKKDLGFHAEPLLSNSARNDLDVHRSLFRDGFFPDGLEQQQARFAWTEEDGNIASLVSEPGFGTTGQTTFGKDLDAALNRVASSEIKQEVDASSSVFVATNRNDLIFTSKPTEPHQVLSTPSGNLDRGKNGPGTCKVDKTDPRSRYHYVKYVKRHGRTIKLWECGICSREFQHQYTLMRHLPTHTDERNFHCDACGKSFRQLSTLSQHRAIHSAERPYACEVCSKTFNRVSTLISHRKTHSDEKPYKCHLCPKGFHQKGNLRNHLFTHTNERPYRCNICLKGFNQQSNLVCHKNKSHPEDGCPNVIRTRSDARISRPPPAPQPDSIRPPVNPCDIPSSSVGPIRPAADVSLSNYAPKSVPWDILKTNQESREPSYAPKIISWDIPKTTSESAEPSYAPKTAPWDFSKNLGSGEPWKNDALWSSGVIVDHIMTYHMGIALALKQTPFALLKPDDEAPVLVKVIDVDFAKQMLVPATAEDLIVNGEIILKNDESSGQRQESGSDITGAVHIKVPVVATVVPKIKPGGRLHLVVEEPHHDYHTVTTGHLSARSAAKHAPMPPPLTPAIIPRPESVRRPEPCNSYDDDDPLRPGPSRGVPQGREPRAAITAPCPEPLRRPESCNDYDDDPIRPGGRISSTCALLPPAPSPSPPQEYIPMDLFEEVTECKVCDVGFQNTAVHNLDKSSHSDDSDIFIGKFEEGIALSDSE